LRDQGQLDEALELAEDLAERATLRTHRTEAQELVEEIEQLKRDRDRERRLRPPSEEEEAETRRPISPVQVVWGHDAEVGSVESGATYQYRMRVLLYNRYAAVPELLKDPQQAIQTVIVGPWSDPSDPVETPLDTRFFLTSGGRRERDRVKVEVFKWFEGFWVRHNFTVSVGERIGGRKRARIENDNPWVDFDTGCIVLDIDFDRPFRERGTTRKDGSFEFEAVGTTVALVYVDADGDLNERLLDIDRDDPAYKELKGQVFREKKERRVRPRPEPRTGSRSGSGDRSGRGGRRGGGSRGGRGGRGGGEPGGGGGFAS
jgi:hypothetical protein